MSMKSRLQNKAFWVALAAFVALMAKTFNLFTVPTNYDLLVNGLLGLLTMLGIIIDPTTPGIVDNPTSAPKVINQAGQINNNLK